MRRCKSFAPADLTTLTFHSIIRHGTAVSGIASGAARRPRRARRSRRPRRAAELPAGASRAAPQRRAAARVPRPRQWAKNPLLLAAPAAGGPLGVASVGARGRRRVRRALHALERDLPAQRRPRPRAGPLACHQAAAPDRLRRARSEPRSRSAACSRSAGLALALRDAPGARGVGSATCALTFSYSLWLRHVVVARHRSRSPPASCCARSPAAPPPASTSRAGSCSSPPAARSSSSPPSALPSCAAARGGRLRARRSSSYSRRSAARHARAAAAAGTSPPTHCGPSRARHTSPGTRVRSYRSCSGWGATGC